MTDDFRQTATPKGDQQRTVVQTRIEALRKIANDPSATSVERINATLLLEKLS